jgi:hypothetical protein
MNLIRCALLLGTTLVAACSGGNGNGTVVTPTPTPGGGATPTPSPGPTYTKVADLTGDWNFITTCAGFMRSGSPSPTILSSAFRQGFSLDYADATQTYSLTGQGVTFSFAPADLDPARPAGTKIYAKPVGLSVPDRFSISAAGYPGTGGAPATMLEYIGRMTLTSQRFPGGSVQDYACIYGSHTLVTDRPAGTIFTYSKTGLIGTASSRADGSSMVASYSLSKSSVTFTANLATGKVETVITLVGTPPPSSSGGDVNLGVIRGTADIDPDTGGFYGSWSSTDREAIGTFSGGFFGPQGKEAAFMYEFSGRNSSAVLNFSASGTVYAIR